MKEEKIYKNHLLSIWKSFCDSTSLHGYNYLYNASSLIQKLFWLIVISIATAIGIVLLVENTKNYSKATIVTTVDSSSAPLDVSENPQIYLAKLNIL